MIDLKERAFGSVVTFALVVGAIHFAYVNEAERKKADQNEIEDLVLPSIYEIELSHELPEADLPDVAIIEPEKITPTITVHTRPNCPPCHRWMAEEAPKWRSVGWVVEESEWNDDPKPTPHFTVRDSDGDVIEFRFYLTPKMFSAEKDKMKNDKR